LKKGFDLKIFRAGALKSEQKERDLLQIIKD